MLKSVLKCMESIRIKKMGKKIFNIWVPTRWGGGGGPAELVKSQLFDFFLNPSLIEICGNKILPKSCIFFTY